LIAVDTSVVVAGFASWHEGHEAATSALARKPRLPAHVLIETYSVLTRLPAPHRAPADLVAGFLSERFPATLLTLSASAYRDLVGSAVTAGLIGGAVYDALIAETAKRAGALLLTRDRRALATYERIGVRYELVS
jgi:predicted nucleic acid-binding protein